MGLLGFLYFSFIFFREIKSHWGLVVFFGDLLCVGKIRILFFLLLEDLSLGILSEVEDRGDLGVTWP